MLLTRLRVDSWSTPVRYIRVEPVQVGPKKKVRRFNASSRNSDWAGPTRNLCLINLELSPVNHPLFRENLGSAGLRRMFLLKKTQFRCHSVMSRMQNSVDGTVFDENWKENPKDAGATSYTLATPWNPFRYNTPQLPLPVSALSHSRGPGARQAECSPGAAARYSISAAIHWHADSEICGKHFLFIFFRIEPVCTKN